MKKNKFPPGWDEERVRSVIAHYEGQTDDEAVAEDEAAYENPGHVFIEVPEDIVPAVRELIVRYEENKKAYP